MKWENVWGVLCIVLILASLALVLHAVTLFV